MIQSENFLTERTDPYRVLQDFHNLKTEVLNYSEYFRHETDYKT